MSKFITGKSLDESITDIIWEAEETLLILSPYIKLDTHFKQLFNKHQTRPKVHIIIVFGKNEHEVQRSLSKTDFDYFKNFPNISIIYVPDLHAKYYGNEKKGVVTSINLYDHSFKNNIEFGIYTEQTVFNQFGTNLDNDAWNTSLDIAEKNNAVFIKRPVYENKKFIINLNKNYIKSDTLHDSTEYFYGKIGHLKTAKLNDFPDEIDLESSYEKKPSRNDAKDEKPKKVNTEHDGIHGYCIRTGEQIPFNPSQPLSKNAWKIWNQFSDPNYPEKFCHRTGKQSFGKTSMNNPIL
jgi:hypothetical protein